jgi:protein involved in polysaccharide export with SLBB domain
MIKPSWVTAVERVFRSKKVIGVFRMAAAITVIVMIVGCQGRAGTTLRPGDISALNAAPGPESDILAGGDVLRVRFYHNSKLDDEVTIRPDGKISLQLVGDIVAGGLTPSQLASRITDDYRRIFKTSTNGYFIGVGDRLAVKFYYHSELNEEQIVRPDGKITLQLVGEVPAAGSSTAQLTTALKELYRERLNNPEVAVIVRDVTIPEATVTVKEFVSRKVYVSGEVARPGPVSLTGRLRAFDAVISAGGTLNSAELETVVLIRYNGSSSPLVYSLNLDLVRSGELPDVLLKPYDIVYVPKSVIAQVDLFVDQYINKLIPQNVSFPFMYNFNPTVSVQ